MESKHSFEKIARLILLSLYGKAEKSQTNELQAWLKEHKDNPYFYEKFHSRPYLEKGLQEYMLYDPWDGWKQMRRKMRTSKKSFIRRLLPYAAAIAILTGFMMLI
ncbi:MAG: hypothetical protein K2L23_02200, partial [Odoribacter sp.]|nr:hypothetical protein [Odoribacter sp.]